MALTSTLFTGLSGLDVNQTRLNVVGNNIANVNTVAFKASRALAKPQFYVTDSAGSPPTGNFGGTNPNQRGLGATIASVEKDWSTGAIEPTGRPTDLAMDGEGFFIVQGKEQMFTRDGSFRLDSRNRLVNAAGMFVQGFGVDENENIIAGQLQNISIPIGGLTKAEATENVFLAGNMNAAGDLSTSGSILNSNVELFAGGGPLTGATLLTAVEDGLATPQFAAGDVLTLQGTRGGRKQAPLEFTVTATSTVDDLMSFFNQGLAVMPGVVQPNGSTSGAQLKAGPTTGTTLVLVGNTGTANAIEVEGSAFSRNGIPAFGFAAGSDAVGNIDGAVGESIHTNVLVYDSLGVPLSLDITLNLESTSDGGTTWRYIATSSSDTDFATFDPASAGQLVGTGTVDFDTNGRLVPAPGNTITISRIGTGANPNVDIALDFSKVTALGSNNGSTLFAQQDGTELGTLVSFEIGANGTITGTIDNGLTATLGQIAVATFDNPHGLSDNGGNLYSVASNSGAPRVGAPLQSMAGSLRSGALELSNVDLSNEFINLIIASTGFSAASRVITTSDQLMTELLNTSR